MENKRFTFSKSERLCSSKTIELLFTEGKSFVKYPLRISKLQTANHPSTVQLLISVPKKRFKRANKRNLLKRRIREAYRLNKHELTELISQKEYGLALSFIYLPTEILTFQEIEKGVKKGLAELINQHKTDEETPTTTDSVE